MNEKPDSTIPIACDMTGAIDTPEERLAEYQRLFSTALLGRERTEDRLRFRLRDQKGLDAWVRDLSEREHACCPFMFFKVSIDGDEVWWDVSTIEDDSARLVLDGLYELSESSVDSVDDLFARYAGRGLNVVSTDAGFRQATANERRSS